MDRTTLSRERRADLIHDKRLQEDVLRRATPREVARGKTSDEMTRRQRADRSRASVDESSSARHFTVANVGRNGTLYLKPSRKLPNAFVQPPATPPHTSDGNGINRRSSADWRDSTLSGTWTPQLPVARSHNTTGPLPPLSLANTPRSRRTRSHSFSTVHDARSCFQEENEFRVLLNGRQPGERPSSSVDLSRDLLDFRIPHYRLGTPRFSDRGTAYLHNSTYTATSEDLRSSIFSNADLGKLFPIPPNGTQRPGFMSHSSTGSPYLRSSLVPSSVAQAGTSQASLRTPSNTEQALDDQVESRLNDPSLVMYSSLTGKILAATPARLIAEITSPKFLDYELLSDFFLTYRSFLTSCDLLKHLMARIEWAVSNDHDAGRIVTVRTFVALRHWILNYFLEDFTSALQLRRTFCATVNGLANALQHSKGADDSDLKVLVELKKCWKRTCAAYWPETEMSEASANADILPVDDSAAAQEAVFDLPRPARPNSSSLDFRRRSTLTVPIFAVPKKETPAAPRLRPLTQSSYTRTLSIPATPTSEDSMTVLSCSLPFLRHLRVGEDYSTKPRTPTPAESRPKSGNKTTSHRHKRSGSFSDALRDDRPPLPSGQPGSVDIGTLNSIALTGGLVRGLLLQPSPSNVDLLIPISPSTTGEPTDFDFGHVDVVSSYGGVQHQSAGVKRIVHDVRRAFTIRKDGHDSPPASQRSSSSFTSHKSTSGSQRRRDVRPPNFQQLQGPPRVDLLGELVHKSYRKTLDDAAERGNEPAPIPLAEATVDDILRVPLTPDINRLNSHVTAGSCSIIIVDDTGIPTRSFDRGALTSPRAWTSNTTVQHAGEGANVMYLDYEGMKDGPEPGWPLNIANEHEIFQTTSAQNTDPVYDASVDFPQAYDINDSKDSMSALHPQHHQLRRRPGGDLKTVDHVHDLEMAPKRQTGDSYSMFSQAIASSNAGSWDLTGTHFSGQGLHVPVPLLRGSKSESTLLNTAQRSHPNTRFDFDDRVSELKDFPDRSSGNDIMNALAKLEGKPLHGSVRDSVAGELSGPSHGPPLMSERGSQSLSGMMAGSLSPLPPSGTASAALSARTNRQGASIFGMSDSEQGMHSSSDMLPLSQALPNFPDLPGTEAGQQLEPQEFAQIDRDVVLFDGKEGRGHGTILADHSKPVGAYKHMASQHSFFLDANESLSDISTEIAEDRSLHDSLGVRSFYFDDEDDDDRHPVTSFQVPPTPPSTAGTRTNPSEHKRAAGLPRIEQPEHAMKATSSAPGLMATDNHIIRLVRRPEDMRRAKTSPERPLVAHLPFVLAFDSRTIAEQLTIVEKDALDEVNWRDLVGLRWKHKPLQIRNWVDFLEREDCNGIDIVVTRFNLVVKWVVSECLLTDLPTERARSISKYIHVAVHAHRLRNYATTYQITLALLSADLARLKTTWTLVPPADKQLLQHLEKLCQPRGNFHHLRLEMESTPTERGCIPFIGLYTHDLMFNAQKPSQVDPTVPGSEPLVNFERYQTAATIVKGLLRLIESSANYAFRPQPEVLSRCLWLAALEDGEITARSKTLES